MHPAGELEKHNQMLNERGKVRDDQRKALENHISAAKKKRQAKSDKLVICASIRLKMGKQVKR
jgi:hypothetical protein